MEFKDIVGKRYATKQFNGKIIEEAKVNELLELIRFSPSSFNIQPWKIKIITDTETKKKLSPFSWDQPQITTCSHLLVMCADDDVLGCISRLEKLLHGKMPADNLGNYVKMMRNFASGMNEQARIEWAQKQVYLALGNALNGAKSLGFDSCPMEGFDPKGYSEVLNLPKNLHPTGLCPVGYAADTSNPKVRFHSEDVFF